MTEWEIVCQDVMDWAKSYSGEPFHALFCDPSYALSKKKKIDLDAPVEAEIETIGDLIAAYHSVQQWGDTGFMGRDWDSDVAFDPRTWAALAEHLLPGAFLFVFASSRGWHRLACAMEDSGLIIQPSIFGWLNSQAFPKATRIDTAIDKAAGKLAERKRIGRSPYASRRPNPMNGQTYIMNETKWDCTQGLDIMEPATPLARAWEGHRYGGQILKDALGPIICARKPLTIWQTCGILVEEITNLMEVFLCQFINVKIAEKGLNDKNQRQSEASGNSAPLSAFLTNVLNLSTESGKMDIFKSQEAGSTLLNIVTLWNNTLDALWNLGNSSTTLTEIQAITALTTLRSWLMGNIPDIIIKAAFHQNGQSPNVPIAERSLNTTNLKKKGALSVLGNATLNTAKREGGVFANNVERNSTPQVNFKGNRDFTALRNAMAKAKRNPAELTQLAKCAESLLGSLLGQLKTSSITNARSAHDGNRLTPIICAQKPWTNPRLDCIVETGAGALWVNGARIGYEAIRTRGGGGKCGNVYGWADTERNGNQWESNHGRWPSNFCLVHIPPDENGEGGCRRVGVKRVKGHKGYPNGPGGLWSKDYQQGSPIAATWNQASTEADNEPWQGHADPDGYERVDDWDCSPECPVAKLGEQSGISQSGAMKYEVEAYNGESTTGFLRGKSGPHNQRADKGTAARFFYQADWFHEIAERLANSDLVRYVPKAARKERNEGLDDFYWRKDKTAPIGFVRINKEEWEALGEEEERIKEETGKRVSLRAQGNIHPTIKPISLCKWIATLALPPKEYAPRRILIPFAGTMSEGRGAMLAGFEEIVAIDFERDHCDIGEARMEFWRRQESLESAQMKLGL